MNSQNWLKAMESFESTPEGAGFSLRADLSDIVARHLGERGMTQAQLAAAAGMKPQQLSRVIHSNANCTLDTAGRILHALGIKGKLGEADESRKTPSALTPLSSRSRRIPSRRR
jgi:DNA-binding phage protein